MGMPAMRRKQVAYCLGKGPSFAAQHILPAMQHLLIPHCTNRLDL
jgi:hypothetical protein